MQFRNWRSFCRKQLAFYPCLCKVWKRRKATRFFSNDLERRRLYKQPKQPEAVIVEKASEKGSSQRVQSDKFTKYYIFLKEF
jgi:hypothetical protein